MSETTGTAWTDHTANFWLGCTHASPGCVNCYAETLATSRMGLDVWGPRAQRKPVQSVWANVRKWNAAARRDGVRRRVFCMSMGDFFEDRPEVAEIRARAWELIEECDALDWQILTKHADQIAPFLPPDWGNGWPHVWLGVSVENQEWADKRIPFLLSVPAAVRFLSVEPLLGPVDLTRVDAFRSPPWPSSLSQEPETYLDVLRGEGLRPSWTGVSIETNTDCLDWVIVGAESGPGRRPVDPAWAVALQEQCRAAGVAFFFKQRSGPRPGTGTLPDGTTPREFPRSAVPALFAESPR